MLNTVVFGAGPSLVVVILAIALAVALVLGLIAALFVWRRHRRAGADLGFEQPDSLIEGLLASEDEPPGEPGFEQPAPVAVVAPTPDLPVDLVPPVEPADDRPSEATEDAPEAGEPIAEPMDEPVDGPAPAAAFVDVADPESGEGDETVESPTEGSDDAHEVEPDEEPTDGGFETVLVDEGEVDDTDEPVGDPDPFDAEVGPEPTDAEVEPTPSAVDPDPVEDEEPTGGVDDETGVAESDEPVLGDTDPEPESEADREPDDEPEIAAESGDPDDGRPEPRAEDRADEPEPTDPEAERADGVDEAEEAVGEPEADDSEQDGEGDSARVFFTTPLSDAGETPEPESVEASPDEDVIEPAPVQDLVAHTVIGRMTATGDHRAQFSVLTGIDAERDHALLVQTCRIAGDGSIGWTAVRVSPGALEPDLVELVERTLDETGRSPGDLMLDLPAGQPPTRAMVKTLEGLAEMGIPLGLHGFGSRVDQLLEYGSLPLSYVSVDHLALSRFGERGHDIAVQLHRLGHDLGFDAIAIGASTDQDAAEGRRIYRFALASPSAGAEVGAAAGDGPATIADAPAPDEGPATGPVPEPFDEEPPAEPEPPRRRSALHPDFEA